MATNNALEMLRKKYGTVLNEDNSLEVDDGQYYSAPKQQYNPMDRLRNKYGTDRSMSDNPDEEIKITGDYSGKMANIQEKETDDSFTANLWNDINVGLNNLNAGIMRMPATLYDVASIPQNKLVKMMGRPDLMVQSPEGAFNNKFAKYYDEQAKAFDEVPIPDWDEAVNKGKQGDFGAVGNIVARDIVRNAPQQLGIIASALAGIPNVGLGGMGTMAAGGALAEGRKKGIDPDVNAINATLNGVIEAGFESIGTMGILKTWEKSLTKSFGKKATKGIIKDVMQAVISSGLGEGNEEFLTSLAQDASSYMTGVDKNALKGMLSRAARAGLTGMGSGVTMTAPAAIASGKASVEKYREGVGEIPTVEIPSVRQEYEQKVYVGKKAKGFEEAEGKFSSLADKQERVEIPDNMAFFKEGAIDRINKPMTYLDKSFPLSEIYGHRTLYKAYPELKDISIRIKDMPAIGDKGMYDELNNTIVINRGAMVKGLDSVREVLLHEIQHYVQRVEGFARGGSPKNFQRAKDKAMLRINYLNSILSDAARKLDSPHYSKEEKEGVRQEYDYAMKEKLNIDPVIVQSDSYDQYRRLAGEIEARDVTDRESLTSEERRERQPLASQGIPLKEMIVKKDGMGGMSKEESQLYEEAKKYKSAEEFVSPKLDVRDLGPLHGIAGKKGIIGLNKNKGIEQNKEALKHEVGHEIERQFNLKNNDDVIDEFGMEADVRVKEMNREEAVAEAINQIILGNQEVINSHPNLVKFLSDKIPNLSKVVFDLEQQLTDIYNKAQQPTQPRAGGRLPDLNEQEQKAVDKMNPQEMKGVTLRQDLTVKDQFGKTKNYKAGEDIYIYQDPNTGKALVKDGEYGVLPKKSVQQVEQAGNKWGGLEVAEGVTEVVKGENVAVEIEQWSDISWGNKAGRIEYMPTNGKYRVDFRGGTRSAYDSLDEAKSALDDTAGNIGMKDTTKYSNYQLPGGENYEETLWKLPEPKFEGAPVPDEFITRSEYDELANLAGMVGLSDAQEARYQQLNKKQVAYDAKYKRYEKQQKSIFKSHAFPEESNNYGWMRTNWRTTPDGKKVLFLEEVQHVNPRKDKITQEQYDALPDYAKGNKFYEYSLKKVLEKAVKEGADSIAWTTGEQQADRYDLSKQIDTLVYHKNDDGTYSLGYIQKGLERVDSDPNMTNIAEKDIANIVGKDAAKKIINDEGTEGRRNKNLKELSGNDLKVGGEWAKNLYDRQIPNILKKLTKGKISKIDFKGKTDKYIVDTEEYLESEEEGFTSRDITATGIGTQQSLEITPQIRRQVIGQPMAGGQQVTGQPEDDSFEFGANIVEDIKPDKQGKSATQRRLDEITEAKVKREVAEEMLENLTTVTEPFKNRIKDKISEETKIPTYYRTNNPLALTIDEATDQYNRTYGSDLSTSDFLDFMINSETERANLKSEIETQKAELRKKVREETFLKTKLRTMEVSEREGARKQRKLTQQEQTDTYKNLKESGLTLNDQGKFLASIKNTDSMEVVNDRINKLKQAATVRKLRTDISQELKYTKPIKQKSGRKGKYDYETNKIFNDLRDYSKLSQEKAENALGLMAEDMETSSEIDSIKKRFLSLQTNGSKASETMARIVLADIQRLKRIGEETKTEADMIKRINKQEKVVDMRQSISDIRGTSKKGFITSVVNLYRKGFSNIPSLINSIAGKKSAETYNPQLAEEAKKTAIYKRTRESAEGMAERLGIETKKLTLKFSDMTQDTYDLVRPDEVKDVHIEINRLDIMDIYNAIKNDKTRSDYYDNFGKEQIDALVQKLTPEERSTCDYAQEEMQKDYPVLNEHHIETKNLDLGRVDNYWKATSEKPIDISEGMRIQGETPGSEKSRAKGRVIPRPDNFYLKFMRHIHEVEHVRHLTRKYVELKKLFSDYGVQKDINHKFGKDVYKVLMNQIEELSLNKISKELDMVTNMLGKGLNNWIVAKIALNPSVFAKQLISVVNYAEDMDPGQWSKWFAKGLSHPKQTFDFMWKNIPYLEARFNQGYSEALESVMHESGRMSGRKQRWVNGMTFLVRTGDIGAIIYGGYPIIKDHLAKNPGDMEGAIKKFKLATIAAQQAALKSSRSQFQNQNGIARLFLAFKNTPTQYLRKLADASISYAQGDIDVKQFTKTMMIYAVIQPALYGIAGVAMRSMLYGGDDEEDKYFNAIMEALILNPFNAIPLINDLVKASVRKMQGKNVWKVISMPLFDDVVTSYQKVTKKDVSLQDVVYEIAALTAEVTAGAPVRTYERILKKRLGKKATTPMERLKNKYGSKSKKNNTMEKLRKKYGKKSKTTNAMERLRNKYGN